MLDSRCALVDNDFFNQIIIIKRNKKDICSILSNIFEALGKTPMLHPWISEYEALFHNDIIDAIFDNSIITKSTWPDIHRGDKSRELYYSLMFRDFYKKVYGVPLDVALDIYTYHIAGQSLGEIHNITACICCGCNLILSDDNDTINFKRIISQTVICDFEIYNRADLVEQIRAFDNTLKRADLKAFSHGIKPHPKHQLITT